MISAEAPSVNRILIFDDTRLIANTLLARLTGIPEDIIVIAEKDLENQFSLKLLKTDNTKYILIPFASLILMCTLPATDKKCALKTHKVEIIPS